MSVGAAVLVSPAVPTGRRRAQRHGLEVCAAHVCSVQWMRLLIYYSASVALELFPNTHGLFLLLSIVTSRISTPSPRTP